MDDDYEFIAYNTDDLHTYNDRHDSECPCAECERYWARLNARHR